MARKKTPLITMEIPAEDDEFCDTEEIGRMLLEKHFGTRELDFDLLYPPVRIVARHPTTGKVVLAVDYEPADWDCLATFLDNIRHRLSEFIGPEPFKRLEDEVEALGKQLGIARERGDEWEMQADFFAEEARGLREGFVDSEGLRSAVELEKRTRARGELEQLAGIQLHRWSHPTIKSIVREAREALR